MDAVESVTITLRARFLPEAPIAGTFIAAETGNVVYRIARVTSVRTAGDASSQRYRLVCQRLAPGEVPVGAVIGPWLRAPRPPVVAVGKPAAAAAHRALSPGTGQAAVV